MGWCQDMKNGDIVERNYPCERFQSLSMTKVRVKKKFTKDIPNEALLDTSKSNSQIALEYDCKPWVAGELRAVLGMKYNRKTQRYELPCQ